MLRQSRLRSAMARPKPDFPAAAAIRALADADGQLPLRVTPGARSESVQLVAGVVQIKVRAKPEDGKANERVLELLAQALGIATSRLQMLRGATGRNKLVQIKD
jgi:uncharacterized protein